MKKKQTETMHTNENDTMMCDTNGSCNTGSCGCGIKSNGMNRLLLLINTVLLVILVVSTYTGKNNMHGGSVMQALEEMKAMEVGGKENFKMVKELMSLPAFKEQQKAGIEQALNQYKNMPAMPTVEAQPMMPATEGTGQ